MATSAGTAASDVRVEIDTVLSDADIEGAENDPDDTGILGRIEREITREYDSTSVTFTDDQHRQDLEAALAALRIAEGRDRRGESVSSGRTSTEYETAEIQNLRKRVRRADPGEAFGRSSRVTRDTSRHIVTTGDDS
jgi:hypothetical protein